MRPHILNSRVPGCMLPAFLTRAGDQYAPLHLQLHHGPLYLQPGYLQPGYLDRCSCTTARYICGMYRCIIAADPDKNGLGIPDKNPSRTRQRTCTHTMRRRCRSDHTSQHTHIHTHTQHIHAGNVLRIPLAREGAQSGSRVLRSLPILAPRLLPFVRFADIDKRKSTAGQLPTVLCVCCVRSLCTYARLRPSVRPFSFYCCIQVSACSQFAMNLLHSGGQDLLNKVVTRSRRPAIGDSASISSGRMCHESMAMSVIPMCFSSRFPVLSSAARVTNRARSKYMYIGARPVGITEYRTRMDPDHILPIPLKNVSRPAS